MKGRTLINEAGNKYGKLSVITRGNNIRGNAAWFCKCDCGGEKTVAGIDLRFGSVKSCGCLKYIDITGNRYGRLVVMSKTGIIKGNSHWLCKCDCGGEKIVSAGRLKSKNTRSCGCLGDENRVKQTGKRKNIDKSWKKELCKECGKRPVCIKKRKVCGSCYQKQYHSGVLEVLPPEIDIEYEREMRFVRNYFENASDYIYQPASFNIKTYRYSPDFYDIEKNIWIEVVGTREAYRKNKHKYKLFRYYYPEQLLELRAPCGELINEILPGRRKNIRWPSSVDSVKGE